MFNKKNIELALTKINVELNPNELVIARKQRVDYINLKKRFLGQTTSRVTYLSK